MQLLFPTAIEGASSVQSLPPIQDSNGDVIVCNGLFMSTLSPISSLTGCLPATAGAVSPKSLFGVHFQQLLSARALAQASK